MLWVEIAGIFLHITAIYIGCRTMRTIYLLFIQHFLFNVKMFAFCAWPKPIMQHLPYLCMLIKISQCKASLFCKWFVRKKVAESQKWWVGATVNQLDLHGCVELPETQPPNNTTHYRPRFKKAKTKNKMQAHTIIIYAFPENWTITITTLKEIK